MLAHAAMHACGMRQAAALPQPCEAHTAQLRPTARTLRNLRAAAASGDEAPHFGASMPQQAHMQQDVAKPIGEAPELARWQRKRLETAFRAGKRNISVKQLAGDTKLDRKQVLAWLKERVLQPNTPANRDSADAEHANPAEQPFSGNDGGAFAEPPASTAGMSFAERQAVPGGDFARKRMKRSTEMTLEKVFDRYSWPPDDVIAGICELHRELSPGRVKLWFEEQRRLQPRPQGPGRRQ